MSLPETIGSRLSFHIENLFKVVLDLKKGGNTEKKWLSDSGISFQGS